MADFAELKIDGKKVECPVIIGTEGEKAFDIGKLRSQSGCITLDPGFANTGSCASAITFLDGEKGILRYRGIPIEQLAEKSTFVETSYLLIHGRLPNHDELDAFSEAFNEHSMIHEDMINFFHAYPSTSHPMAILSAMVCAMSAYYPEFVKERPAQEEIDRIAIQLLSKVRTICAFSYKKSIGEPFVYPRYDLSYVPNFLNMMFSSPTHPYKIVDEVVRALQVLLILHADHEQNCSTSTVRLVGSSHANLYASISAGICALWGPLHGGANQAVIEMLEKIQKDGGNVSKYIAMAKDKNSNFRLMGFGHRVYKNFDPRAKIIKKRADDLLNKLGIHDPLLELAKKMEETALKDEYFIERKLYPNVDFYSGIIYRAIGIPLNMFPVMFAIGRLPGWIAHWKEMIQDPATKIGRPLQIYVGETKKDYTPIEKR
ncbi:MAG: citrate synthase [Candidatus Omnitrophica bacterium]|nr:citrate synthase [Candidatus Omnitrophota bacterium]MDE2009738.1 citrate synthase [Candidatus Omnitrophota bacterium]MDE2213865.1 citrate synthase [Candidatus Omnitrophota bacterium]MDE2231876.1 citrate synthase [Candidatus Omnitrophota bacterium]